MHASPSVTFSPDAEPAGCFDAAGLRAGRTVLWTADLPGAAAGRCPISEGDVDAARARMRRFAPLLKELFPELAASDGEIESPLLAAGRLQRALGLSSADGTLFVKADHTLPVAGSIKARGGIHEVLEHAEQLALRHGVLTPADDYRVLAGAPARALFGRHTVTVGSTGNLGLAIGTAAAALGFDVEVHMSADAKAWKKERLRCRGVRVVEHAGDYGEAVVAGRAAAAADRSIHFVDDERSLSLLLGYATAAAGLACQLQQAGRVVDARHPLFVYLPCGVGGAPAGIAYGLARLFGRYVHCLFAEPTASPCFLLRMIAGTSLLPQAGPCTSVYDIGLDNRTEADGLAVPRASELAAAVARPLLAGIYTVTDEQLFRHLHLARVAEGLRIEPSAAAGLAGPRMLLDSPLAGRYLDARSLRPHLERATHVVWATGGLFVPEDEYRRFAARGEAAESADTQPR